MADYVSLGLHREGEALPRPLGWLITAAVASLPLVDFGGAMPVIALSPKRAINLSIFDFLVWLAALWLLAWRWRNRRTAAPANELWLRSWLAAVWPGIMLLAVGALSVAQINPWEGNALLLAAKNAWQWAEYLIISPLLAMPLLAAPIWRQRLCRALLFGTALSVLTAFIDFVALVRTGSNGIPHLVGGCLGNRYAYTMFVSLALCMLWDEISLPAWRIWRWPLAFVAFYPALAAGPLLAGLAGLTLASMARQARTVAAILILGLLAALAFLPPAEARSLRGIYLTRSVQVYVPFRHPGTGNIESVHTMRYYRWAAEINLIAARPLGVGWGKYQRAVNDQMGDIPAPKVQSSDAAAYDVLAHEPMSFSWFLQSGVEMGLPGLAAVLVFILEILSRAGGWRGRGSGSPAIAGAAVALLLAGLWTSPMVRGVGPLLGLLLALSHMAAATEQHEEKEKA